MFTRVFVQLRAKIVFKQEKCIVLCRGKNLEKTTLVYSVVSIGNVIANWLYRI